MSRKQQSPQTPAARSVKRVGFQRWQELDTKRNSMMRRIEGYASVTLPSVLLPTHVDQESSSIQYDWTSVGAQAVNNLANRFSLNLFRPGVPFFRLDASPAIVAQLGEAGVQEADLRETLVQAEQSGLKVMDQQALRPGITGAFEHLVVAGNILMDTEDKLSFTGLRNYVVRRSLSGNPIEILTHFELLKDELEDDVRSVVSHKRDDDNVHFVKHYLRQGDRWYLKQYVDEHYLTGKDQEWADANFPIHILTWRLNKGQHYGTGLVEDYSGDFSTLSNLSESEVKLALLMSDYRWLIGYQTQTNPEDFKRTRTGDALMGSNGDISIVSAGAMGQNLQYVSASADKVIRRIGSGFMLGTAVTRNAERVTAEEMRQQAQELEVALGGAYSRLAVEMQLPIVRYLMAEVNVTVNGKELIPTIVTGMDALSRNAEAQQLDQFLARAAQLNGVPEDVRARMKLGEVLSTMAAASGLASRRFVLTDEEFAAVQQQQQEQQLQASAQQGLIDGSSKAIAQGGNAQ